MSKQEQTTLQTDVNGVVLKTKYIPGRFIPKKEFKRAIHSEGDYVYTQNEYYIEDGEQKAKPGEKVDWFGYIQASRNSCDLSQIVARYLAGDSSVVNVSGAGITGDVASMPKNVNEVNDLAKRVKVGYEGLSDEVKGIFGNSFEAFYNAVLNNEIETKIQAYAKAKAEAQAKEAAAAAQLKQDEKKGDDK